MLGRQTRRMESARPYRAPRRHIAPAVAHNTTNAKVVNDKHTESEGHLIPTPAVLKLAAAYVRVSTERHEQW